MCGWWAPRRGAPTRRYAAVRRPIRRGRQRADALAQNRREAERADRFRRDPRRPAIGGREEFEQACHVLVFPRAQAVRQVEHELATLRQGRGVAAPEDAAAVSRHEANPEGAAEDAARNSAEGLDAAKLDITVDATGWEHGETVTVEAKYPYTINLLGIVVSSGDLTSETTERVE